MQSEEGDKASRRKQKAAEKLDALFKSELAANKRTPSKRVAGEASSDRPPSSARSKSRDKDAAKEKRTKKHRRKDKDSKDKDKPKDKDRKSRE